MSVTESNKVREEQREAFAVILHQSVICPCITSDVCRVGWVWNIVQWSCAWWKTKAALRGGIDLSLSGFYGILNSIAIKGEFFFIQTILPRREAKAVFTNWGVSDKRCLEALSEKDFYRLSVLNFILWWKNNWNPLL